MTNPAGIDPKAIEAMQRFLQLMPSGADLILVVLRGHLLIEERLTDMLQGRMPIIPSALTEAHLTFYQLMLIVKGFSYHADKDWLWSAMAKLNTLRNDLIHHIEPKKVEDLARQIVNAIRPVVDLAPLGLTDNVAGRLQAGIALMYATLLTYDWPTPGGKSLS